MNPHQTYSNHHSPLSIPYFAPVTQVAQEGPAETVSWDGNGLVMFWVEPGVTEVFLHHAGGSTQGSLSSGKTPT